LDQVVTCFLGVFGAHRRDALHEDDARSVAVAVLARVIGHRDTRVRRDPLEFATKAEGRGERHRTGMTVAEPERRDAVEHNAAHRGRRSHGDDKIPSQDLVHLIGPCH
jgi:hypothetical protein